MTAAKPPTLRFLRGGGVRAIHDDALDVQSAVGGLRDRASVIETVRQGPARGRFCVCFARLRRVTGDPSHAVCLAQTFTTEAAAKAAEVRWLVENYLLAD